MQNEGIRHITFIGSDLARTARLLCELHTGTLQERLRRHAQG
ncbi:hypothetical protein [Xenophilus sp. Marseille-Q4582]|nr:hypothetical protein [Xenophilus sp. Marseille-Q4582]